MRIRMRREEERRIEREDRERKELIKQMERKVCEAMEEVKLTGTGGAVTGTGGAVCKGATPSVEQPGGRGFKPRLRSLLD
jgi:hypothetical protein